MHRGRNNCKKICRFAVLLLRTFSLEVFFVKATAWVIFYYLAAFKYTNKFFFIYFRCL